MSNLILEHDLLKYHQLNASLYPNDVHENRLWNGIDSLRYREEAASVKAEIQTTMRNLKSGYARCRMFHNRDWHIASLDIEKLKPVLLTYFGTPW